MGMYLSITAFLAAAMTGSVAEHGSSLVLSCAFPRYNRLCYMVLAMLLIFPVTLLRQMSALKFTSIIRSVRTRHQCSFDTSVSLVLYLN